MSDNVNHPSHYTRGFDARALECIDITRLLPFTLGNAVKYVWRAGRKGHDTTKAIEDLEKATWYLRDFEARPCRVERSAQILFDAATKFPADPSEKRRYHIIELILQGAVDTARVQIEEWRGCLHDTLKAVR